MYAATLPFSPDASVSDTRLQRTRGRLKLAFKTRGKKTVISSLFQESAMKARLLSPHRALDAEGVIINTAGGLTGGDEVDIEVAAGARTTVTLSSQACEKIYRSPGNDSVVRTHLYVDAQAKLEWLAQPTILFDRACLHRTTEVHVADDAQFLGIEALVFGRTAMGEAVRNGRICDGWRVKRAGQLIYADTFRLEGEIESILRRPSVTNGHSAIASLVYVGADADAQRTKIQDVIADLPAAGVSAWNGLMVVRLVAPDGYELGRNLAYVLQQIRGRALPRTWSI